MSRCDPNYLLTSELKLKPTYSSCSKSNLSWQVPNLLSNPQDLHPYFYVGNNPINDTDPTGLYPGEDPIIINPPGDKWPPPPTDCPICYAELVMGYYYCNVQWSNCYLCGTPHDACDKAAAECKRMVYTRYKRCCNKNK